MSLWDNFKKKIERTSSGLDFWDKEENKRQRDFYAGVQPPAPQTGVLEVARPQAQPNISVDTRQPNFNVSVDTQPQPQPSLRLPSGQTMAEVEAAMTPEQRLERSVNSGLDSGQSWEDISRNTGIDLNEVRNYSMQTRPNYGISMEKPQQSFWNKARDLVDANTEADKWRRYNANQENPAQASPVVAVNPGNLISNTVGAVPRMFNTAANQIVEVGYTGQQQFATNEYTGAVNEYSAAVKSGDPAWIARAKARVDGAAQRVSDINNMIEATKSGYGDGGGLFNAGTLYNEEDSYKGDLGTGIRKIGGGTAEGMLDVASLGLTSVTGKQIAKQGFKTALKEGAPIIAKNAAVNTAQGGVSAYRQGGDAGDIIKSAAISGTAGTLGDLLLATGGAGIYSGKNKIAELLTKASTIETYSTGGKAGTAWSSPSKEFSKTFADEGGETVARRINPTDYLDTRNLDQRIQLESILGKSKVDDMINRTDNGLPAHTEAGEQDLLREAANQLGYKGIALSETDKITKFNGEDVISYVDGVDPKPQNNIGQTGGADLTKRGGTSSMADIMNKYQLGNKVTEDLDERIARENGIDASTVRRLRSGYGEEKLMSVLNPNKDLVLNTPGRANDKNAFVVAAMREKYGSPNVRIAREPKPSSMTPEELASLEASAPPVPKIAEDLKVDVPTPKPQVPESTLGKMAETFYEAAAGNQKISFVNLQKLGETISRQIDDDFTAIGSDFSDVARRVQEGARNGIKSLDEVLTPEEAQILRKAQAEMNYIRRRASTGRKEVGQGNFGEMYLPQVKAGGNGSSLFEEFRKVKPGSEFTRKNKIELEDLDYSPDVIGQYIVRYGDTKRFREQRIFDTLKKANPNLEDEQVSAAATKIVGIQDKVNSIKTKIGAFGFGSRKQLADGEFVDVADELSQVGKDLGHKQISITSEGKGLTNGDRINSVMVGDKTLADHVGFNQYRDAMAYSAQQVIEAGGDRMALARMVEQRLMKEYNLSPEDLEYAVGGISRIAQNVPDEVLNARVLSTYRNAAKQQMMENLQRLDITNKKLRRDVSSLANQILREGSIEDELSNKIVKGILTTQNAIFRKLNVSSAINELSDMSGFYSVYGKNLAVVPDFSAIERYGLGSIDAAIEPYIKQINEGKSLKSVISKINNATNLYHFVEAYKAGVIANSVRKAYPDLVGDALTQRMLRDYRDLALPVDAFTKTFLDNTPLYTQYMTWGLRNLQKEGRLATGKISAGVLEDKSTMERIARNAYANIPAKTAFWLSSNALKGTGILTAFGLTDFTGMTNSDFSGISEEDKSWFDRTTQYTNTSTTLSLLNKVVQAYEKEQLKNKYADKDYNPYADSQWDQVVIDTFKPSFYRNIQGAQEMMSKGYSENAGGRVQYEAPTDWWNTAKAYVFGKGQTENARDYSGRKNIQDRVADGENPFGAMIDMAKEQLGLQDTNYTRPLTDKYSEAYKKADKNGRTDLLAGGRAFNNFLDDLKKDNPEAYNTYIQSMDGNHVNPEYWKAIGGEGDLTTFNMMKNRKKQAFKDLGTVYDPIYDLTDEKAKAVIQQKSAATGDDLALRNALYKEQWYKDYMARVKDYYDKKPESEEGEFDSTQRVKDWYSLNDQYNALRTTSTDTGERPDWSMQFPTVYAQKVINAQYGFDSEESKNFFRTYGDQYKNEKLAYDKANLDLINKMRAIEGYPPMSEAQYAQVTNIADTDSSNDKKYGYSRKSGGSGGPAASFGDKGSFKLPTGAKINSGVKIARNKAYQPKAVKIQRNKKKA